MVSTAYQRLFRDLCEEECVCGPKCLCEGLECLCRPRFFAGQLLTDEDLKRLDHYIVAKDRLHNRYLHGTGVVCGLEVVCNPCDDTVTVRTGYAIGPCGEDIVVCKDTSVDIAELSRAHRHQKAKADDCRPYGEKPRNDCEAAEQEWILAICYQEQPSRGVTSLRHPPKETCGCGCGGGSGCTCGGHSNGHTNGHAKNGSCGCTTKSRTPVQCEPTLTCEGYTFKLIKPKPKTSRDDDRASSIEALSKSELGKKVFCCLTNVLARVQQFPKNATPQQLSDFCCDFKADLRTIIETGNVHDCMLGARLSDILCPETNDPQFTQKLQQSLTLLLHVAIDLFKSCVCSALLPPCPVSSPDDCVPLATLTVRTADLRVLYICNWSARKFVVTFPTLGYWLGWMPFFETLRDAMVKLCCTRRREPKFDLNENNDIRERAPTAQPVSAVFMATAATTQPAPEATMSTATPKGTAFTNLTASYARRTTSLSGLEATVLAGLGLKGEGNVDLANELELLNPMAALGLTRLAAPAGESLVPGELTEVLGQLFKRERRSEVTATPAAPAAPPATVTLSRADTARMVKLEKAVANLVKKVDTQKKTIADLKKARRNG